MKKKRLYGLQKYWPKLTKEQAEIERNVLFVKQKGCCAICGKHQREFKRRLNVDHNHKTGQVRGLLCYRCNKFIVGRHDYQSASRLLKYLEVECQN